MPLCSSHAIVIAHVHAHSVVHSHAIVHAHSVVHSHVVIHSVVHAHVVIHSVVHAHHWLLASHLELCSEINSATWCASKEDFKPLLSAAVNCKEANLSCAGADWLVLHHGLISNFNLHVLIEVNNVMLHVLKCPSRVATPLLAHY